MLKLAKIMDYSLLLIIANNPNERMTQEENKAFNTSKENVRYHYRIFTSSNGKYIFCLGIIDCLQLFDISKFLENKYKRLLHGKEIKNISAVDPVLYSTRMIDFLSLSLK